MKLSSVALACTLSISAKADITSIVAYSESRGNPCATNVKYAKRDAGGLSIGLFQMSSVYGNAQKLVEYMDLDMEGIDPEHHANAYASRFTALCLKDPEFFKHEQTRYLLTEWPEWRAAKRRYKGLVEASDGVAALALSTVVSHGYEGSKPILKPLLSAYAPMSMPDLIYIISNSRACAWRSRGSRHWAGWKKRAYREYKQAMEMDGRKPDANVVLGESCNG